MYTVADKIFAEHRKQAEAEKAKDPKAYAKKYKSAPDREDKSKKKK